MFNGKKIESLEQSVTTLIEGLEKTNNMIEALFSNFEEVVEKLNDVRSENDKLKEEIKNLKEKDIDFSVKFDEVCINQNGLAERYNSLGKSLNIYANSVDKDLDEIREKSDRDNSVLREEIRKVSDIIDELKCISDKADEKHSTQIEALTKSTDALVKKCEDIQLSNVQIMNEHRDMIKRYEESIKGYAEQTERMKNNVLKKMNANNIISVVEE